MKLKNQTAIITGSSSGIGAGVAKSLSQEGANVVINYPNEATRLSRIGFIRNYPKWGKGYCHSLRC